MNSGGIPCLEANSDNQPAGAPFPYANANAGVFATAARMLLLAATKYHPLLLPMQFVKKLVSASSARFAALGVSVCWPWVGTCKKSERCSSRRGFFKT